MATNFDLLAQSFTRYVVSPLNAFGLGGFVFDIEGETTLTKTADITDHYLEDNTTVQDHIAIRPSRITLRGYIGELVYYGDDNTPSTSQKVVQKLTTISGFLPQLSAAATQAKGIYDASRAGTFSLDSISLQGVNKFVDFYALAKNLLGTTNSRQQQLTQYFSSLMDQKIPVGVQTPFEFLTNMAIESIVASQGEESRFMSEFTITLKKMRTVALLSAPYDQAAQRGKIDLPPEGYLSNADIAPYEAATRTAQQAAPVKNIGNIVGLSQKALNAAPLRVQDLTSSPDFDFDALPKVIIDRYGELSE